MCGRKVVLLAHPVHLVWVPVLALAIQVTRIERTAAQEIGTNMSSFPS